MALSRPAHRTSSPLPGRCAGVLTCTATHLPWRAVPGNARFATHAPARSAGEQIGCTCRKRALLDALLLKTSGKNFDIQLCYKRQTLSPVIIHWHDDRHLATPALSCGFTVGYKATGHEMSVACQFQGHVNILL
jgi:hypothetical protein